MKRDKLLHLLAGIAWTVLILHLTRLLPEILQYSLALGGVFTFALVKEILDKLGGGVCDSMDFVYTLAGYMIVYSFMYSLAALR